MLTIVAAVVSYLVVNRYGVGTVVECWGEFALLTFVLQLAFAALLGFGKRD